ncbi:unnamed protein product [Rangifer tarandus platyrhynchus]|uniref:Uncharacterized protein n=1 Tax=Rangifer tarandus platyrhynchus TaxID=3082113 RepID=A0AC59Y9F9_RANTA
MDKPAWAQNSCSPSLPQDQGLLLPNHARSPAVREPPPQDVPERDSLPAVPGPLYGPFPHQPTEPSVWQASPGATGRSPAESLARARLRGSSRGFGQAGGRPAGGRAGRSACESPALIAELRLLGLLNPRAAGRARPPARLPACLPAASEPVASVGGRSGRPRGQRQPG